MNHDYVFLPPAACSGAQADLLVQVVSAGVSRSLSFAEAQSQLSADWTLVLPVEAVTACAVSLPTRKARWLRQALPFAVEDLLAEEVELMHLALGEQLSDGRHRVFALRRSWLSAWLQLCALPPLRITVDADLLPGPGSSLLILPQRWLLGGAAATRMALTEQDWPQVQALAGEVEQVNYQLGEPAPAAWAQAQALAEPYVWLAQQSVRNNLAQGEFAVQRSSGQWQRWRSVAALLGLWLVVQWGFNLAQSWHLQRQADQYAAASAALYQELFPQDTKLINLRAQFEQHLRETGGSAQSPLLSLLAQVSQVMQTKGVRVQINQLDFSEARGDMALQVQAPGFAELEQLREHLQGSGLAVQLGSASRDGAMVSARVVIGG
ncbi:type II secretion system protein GspL [Pseudomonas sp. 5P_3.1_Bac2]|uniref:type II secretion system protein GspL n=1 Tax=Pseudomonas sp. 5P_3.1_Bac2 TaxID=2971617 RepID=UPI0021C6427A|nr:type II secretion system protein GspL [Pseudomonas sp. 5P_3.1_Bac2]MCU1716030.1 type II secretion system protein GspL [Pseudomonas sp. 5P_3.1_Bac2]